MGDFNMEEDGMRPRGVVRELREALAYVSWAAFILNSILAIGTILNTPGLGAKIIVAIDLGMESCICGIAKILFFKGISIATHEFFYHQRFLWLFDPVFGEVVEEDEDEDFNNAEG